MILTADMRKPVGGFVWCDPFCFWRPLIDLAEKQKPAQGGFFGCNKR
ncbi:MAG: hypothetical protein IPJ73_04910 [Zoogloea sp.]|nr:hypothetical protein [Zoogloea sp.]